MTKTLVRGGLSKRRWLAIAIGICIAGVGVAAWAFWSPGTSAGSGSSSADTVNQGATPTGSSVGRTVTVSWGASTLAGGTAVDGYIVKRYNANTDALQTILSSCTGTVAALTCDEHSVAPGGWKYTVTPVIGDNWHGAESAKSGTVTVVSPQSLSLAKSNYGTADFPGGNATVTGTAHGFDNGETLTYKLDDPSSGTTLSGTPSAADSSGDASISLTLPQPSDGAHTIYVVGGNGNLASAGIVVDTVAPTVTAQVTPAANGAGWNNTSPVSVTLSPDDGTGSGINFTKYTDDGTDPTSSGTAQTYSGPISVSSTKTIKFFTEDNAGNDSSVGTKQVNIDTTAPDFGSPALTFSESDAFDFVSGTTVYYNPQSTNTGSFTVNAPNVADAGSGIDKVNFPALSNVTGGGDVSNPGPYSSTYNWTSSSDASGSQTVTATNVASLQSTSGFTVTPDTTAPSVGTPTVTAGYYTSASVPVAFQTPTDGGSGINAGTVVLQRDQANLSNNVCGAFQNTWATTVTLVSGNDTTVTSAHCYKWRERASDNVSNQTTSGESAIAKVDTSAPAFGGTPLTISESNPNSFASGSTLFYNPSASNSGSFTVLANVTDPQSDIQKVNFPSIGTMTGGGADVNNPGPYQTAYSWDNTSNASGAQTVTAYNNANSTSNTANFTVTPDTTPPTILAPTVTAGYYTTASVHVGLNASDPGGSGVDGGSVVVQRDDTTLSNGTCDPFPGTFTTTVTLNGSGNDTTVASGHCYQWRESASDNVGNAGIPSAGSNIAKIDTSVATFGATPLTLTSNSSNAFVSGTTVYTNNAAGASFKVKANNVTDPESGVQKVTFPSITGMSGSGDVTTPLPSTNDYETTYTRTATITAGTKNVTATNNAGGVTANQPFSVVNDTTAPGSGALAGGTGTVASPTAGTVYNASGNYTVNRTDYTETQSATASGLASSNASVATATYTQSTGACGSFGTETALPAGAISPTGQTEGCYRYTLTGTDNVTNSASVQLIVIVDTTAPTISTVVASGGTAGKVEKGDTIVVTYSERIKVSSMCSTWTAGGTAADGTNQSLAVNNDVVVNLIDGGTNPDTMTVTSGACTLRLGTIGLGAIGYVTGGNATFSGSGGNKSQVDYNASTHAMTILLGTKAGAGTIPTTAVTSSVLTLTPTASPNQVFDIAGNALTGTFTSGNVSQF